MSNRVLHALLETNDLEAVAVKATSDGRLLVSSTGGGGGGSGFYDLLYTDDTGVVFVYRDNGSGAMSAFRVPAGTAYTVGANPRPYAPATQPVSAASLPLPTGAATETTLSALNTKIPSQAIAGLLPVDTLGTPGTPRVQATSGTAASIALTSTCRRFSMYATTGTWYSISGTATSSSHYIAAGERLDLDCSASTTVSVLQESTAGSIRITELT